MGLIRDLVEIKRLKNMTRHMVENGLISQEDSDEIWSSAKEAGRQAYYDAKEKQRAEEQRRSSVACCDNCYWFSHNVFSIDYAANCLKHDIDFTHDDIDSNRHRRKCCDNFKPK